MLFICDLNKQLNKVKFEFLESLMMFNGKNMKMET